MNQFGLMLKKIRREGESARLGEEVKERRRQYSVLSLAIPRSKRTKTLRRMARILIDNLFFKNKPIDNYYLAKYFKIKIRNNNKKLIRKLTKKIYKDNEKKYNKRVKNCFRTLRKVWRPIGYDVRFNKNGSLLVKSTLDPALFVQN